MLMSLGKNLREKQSIEVKENKDFPDDEAVKVSKLIMPQDLDLTTDGGPNKVMNIDPDLKDTASALPSSNSLGETPRSTEQMRKMLMPQSLAKPGPVKVIKVESKLKDTAPALPSSSGMGVSPQLLL